MSNKFKNVPDDSDTRILVEMESRLDEYDILYQRWIWQQIVSGPGSARGQGQGQPVICSIFYSCP